MITKYIVVFLVLLCHTTYSQDTLKANMTIIIDNEIVTGGIGLNFVKEDGKVLLTERYHIGKEIRVSKDWFDEKVFLKFSYIGKSDEGYTNYTYEIDLLEGYIYNTSYMILRIYNFDKPKFRKAYCDHKKNYAFDIQNQNYTMQQIQCGDFESFECK